MVSDETIWKSLIFAVSRWLNTSCLASLMSKCDLTVKSANLKLAKEFGSVLRKLTAIEIETSMTRQIGCNIALAVILKVGPALSKFYHLQAFSFSANTVTLKHREFVSMIPIQLCSETTPRFEKEAGPRLDSCPRDSGTSFGAWTRGNIVCDWGWRLPLWEMRCSSLPENKTFHLF